MIETRVIRQNAIVCGMKPEKRYATTRFRRSRRIIELLDRKYNIIVSQFMEIARQCRDKIILREKMSYIKKMYDIMYYNYYPLLKIRPFYGRDSHIWLNAMNMRIDYLVERLHEHHTNNTISATIKRSVTIAMLRFRKRYCNFKTEHYYKLWLIRQILPSELYRLVSSYFCY